MVSVQNKKEIDLACLLARSLVHPQEKRCKTEEKQKKCRQEEGYKTKTVQEEETEKGARLKAVAITFSCLFSFLVVCFSGFFFTDLNQFYRPKHPIFYDKVDTVRYRPKFEAIQNVSVSIPVHRPVG